MNRVNTPSVILMPSSAEIRSVRARYPQAEVFGTGSYGALSECRGVLRLVLFQNELAATNAISGMCSAPAGCKRLGYPLLAGRDTGFEPAKPMPAKKIYVC
jgi:hypothetical protein